MRTPAQPVRAHFSPSNTSERNVLGFFLKNLHKKTHNWPRRCFSSILLRPWLKSPSHLYSSDAPAGLRCVNTWSASQCVAHYTPQSANLNFSATGAPKTISALIPPPPPPPPPAPAAHYLWSFSLLLVSFFLWGNYVSLSVCGQHYILCKLDLEMVSRTWRSCSFFPLSLLFLGYWTHVVFAQLAYFTKWELSFKALF